MADLVERLRERAASIRRLRRRTPVDVRDAELDEAAAAALKAEASEGVRRGLEPTEAMIEAAAKAIHDHWQNGPGPHARTWEKCCRDLPAAAADFRAKARVGLVAALIPEAPVREGE